MSNRRQALAVAFLSLAIGCQEDVAASSGAAEPAPVAAVNASVVVVPPASATAPASGPSQSAKARQRDAAPVSSVARMPGGPAARVVFLDQEHHCPCNAEQIASAWKVIDSVRKRRPSLKVERVHADVDRKREASQRAEHNFWTFPAIYVYDARGGLVALLQGDLAENEILSALR